ncbi:MAG: glycoside hydrolase family 16 protein [Planctomycetota bacterium]
MVRPRKAFALVMLVVTTGLAGASETVGIHYMSEHPDKINRRGGWEADCDSQCYAWKPEGKDTESASVVADTEDKTEGTLSYRFTLNHGWSRWVLEMKDGRTVDYSRFDRLAFDLKSSEAKYWDSFSVIIEGDGGQFEKPITELGFAADGNWHRCTVPIGAIAAAGVDTKRINKLFQIAWGGGVMDGHELKLDNLHLQKGAADIPARAGTADAGGRAVAASASGTWNPFGDMSGYELLWYDEFNEDGAPDPMNWTYEEGFARNNELQWYQKENAFCRDGKLIIEARRERKPNPNYEAGSADWRTNREHIEYTSSSLLTKGMQSWTYGRFEIRAKVDTRLGMWPAIWMLGDKGEWPSCGEIDIMEYYRGAILANVVWGTEKRWVGEWDTAKRTLRSLGRGWEDRFHVWRMDWDEKKIRLYVDDILLNETDLAKTVNPTDRGPRNPFHNPQYMLLNLAVGGHNGGDPSPSEFPARYEVDYVRVYQKKR